MMDFTSPWIITPLLTLCGLMITMVAIGVRIATDVVAASHALGAMVTKLDAALAEIERIRPLEARVAAVESGVEHLKEQVHGLAGAAQTKVR